MLTIFGILIAPLGAAHWFAVGMSLTGEASGVTVGRKVRRALLTYTVMLVAIAALVGFTRR